MHLNGPVLLPVYSHQPVWTHDSFRVEANSIRYRKLCPNIGDRSFNIRNSQNAFWGFQKILNEIWHFWTYHPWWKYPICICLLPLYIFQCNARLSVLLHLLLIPPSISVFFSILRVWLACAYFFVRKIQEWADLLESHPITFKLHSVGWQQSCPRFQAAIHCCSQGSQWQLALHLFVQMKIWKLEPMLVSNWIFSVRLAI